MAHRHDGRQRAGLIWRVVVLVGGTLLAVTTLADPAVARGDGSLTGGGLSGSIGITVTAPGAGSGGSPSNPSYRVVRAGVACADDQNPALGVGQVYEIHYADPGTGGTSIVSVQCVFGGAVPAPPPPPPTAAEVWAHVPLNRATIGTSPTEEGVTGLETRMWCAGISGPIHLNLSLRGYRLTVTATPDRFVWQTGDGGGGASGTPGSPEQPSIRHTYQQNGDYLLSVAVRWDGRYTFSGYGTSQSANLGSVTATRTRGYHVYEVRGVLTG